MRVILLFILFTIIKLFIESYHDYRMAVNAKAVGKWIQWCSDYEQITKIIKALLIQVILIGAGIIWGFWIGTPIYWALRFLFFDTFYYSWEKQRLFFFTRGMFLEDLIEWWNRHTIVYWFRWLKERIF